MFLKLSERVFCIVMVRNMRSIGKMRSSLLLLSESIRKYWLNIFNSFVEVNIVVNLRRFKSEIDNQPEY